MIKFQGCSTLKQYMPMKPIKCGIKVWVLGDSTNSYFSRFSIYTGKGEERVGGLGTHVVNTLMTIIQITPNRGEHKTMQRGKVSASVWMDNKPVTVMSTNTQPSATGSVLRRQRDCSRISVPCPEAILSYNAHMGGVDQGDQLRGYYSCRTKSRTVNFINTFFTSFLKKLGVNVTRDKPSFLSCLTSRILLNKSNVHAEPSE